MTTKGCPISSEDLLRMIQRALEEVAKTRSDDPGHLYDEDGEPRDFEFLACLQQGLTSEAEELALIEHLRGCPFCFRRFFTDLEAEVLQFAAGSQFRQRLAETLFPDSE